MTKHMITRDEARREFVRHGLTYERLTRRDIELLHALCVVEVDRVNRRPETSISEGLRMRRKFACKVSRDGLVSADLRVDGSYFEDRQAITFEEAGWVGFAGWASDANVQTFLRAWMKWCAIVSGADC